MKRVFQMCEVFGNVSRINDDEVVNGTDFTVNGRCAMWRPEQQRVALMVVLVQKYSKHHDLVLDLFFWEAFYRNIYETPTRKFNLQSIIASRQLCIMNVANGNAIHYKFLKMYVSFNSINKSLFLSVYSASFVVQKITCQKNSYAGPRLWD